MRMLLALALGLSLGSAQADGLLGVYAGAEGWRAEYSGQLGLTQDPFQLEQELNLEEESFSSVYLGLDLPLLPGLMLKQSTIESDSQGLGSGQLGGIALSGDLNTHLDLSYTEGTIYAELLDNVFELDLGLSVRQFDGEVRVTERSGRGLRITIDATLPMLYGHARVHLPATGLSAGVRAQLAEVDDNQMRDIQTYVRYKFNLGPTAEVALEGGFRDWRLDLEDLDDLEGDLRLSGPYFGLNLAF